MRKTRFTLKNVNGEWYNKKFLSIEKAFEIKHKLQQKGESWDVYALTPFGKTIVFENEIWMWR